MDLWPKTQPDFPLATTQGIIFQLIYKMVIIDIIYIWIKIMINHCTASSESSAISMMCYIRRDG